MHSDKGQPRRWPFVFTAGLASLLLWPAAFLASAQTASAAQPTAAQLARAVDRHYNALRSLRVRFAESYVGMGGDRTESGELLLRKPGKMRWAYSSPPGKVFVLDGQWGWFYSPGDAQVQRIPAKQLDDLRSPLRFLLGHTQLEKELSGLSAAPEAGDLFRLSGIPRGMEQRVQSLTLEVTAAGVIRSMALEEAGGARTTFTFADEEPNAPAPASAFAFIPPEGVPVVEGLPPV